MFRNQTPKTLTRGIFGLVLLCGLQGLVAPSALADSANLCSAGQTLSSYNSHGCTFNDQGSLTNNVNHWSVSYHDIDNGRLALSVYFDSTVPSDVAAAGVNALNDWTNSSAHVELVRVSTLASADIVVYGKEAGTSLNAAEGQQNPSPAFQTDPNCLQQAGVTRIGITSAHQVPIFLNYHYWDATHRTNGNCSIPRWRMTIGHELGHAMGLNHNNILPTTTPSAPKQLMNGCSNTSCNPVYGPQAIDTTIFNLLYPLQTPPCNPVCSSCL